MPVTREGTSWPLDALKLVEYVEMGVRKDNGCADPVGDAEDQ